MNKIRRRGGIILIAPPIRVISYYIRCWVCFTALLPSNSTISCSQVENDLRLGMRYHALTTFDNKSTLRTDSKTPLSVFLKPVLSPPSAPSVFGIQRARPLSQTCFSASFFCCVPPALRVYLKDSWLHKEGLQCCQAIGMAITAFWLHFLLLFCYIGYSISKIIGCRHSSHIRQYHDLKHWLMTCMV